MWLSHTHPINIFLVLTTCLGTGGLGHSAGGIGTFIRTYSQQLLLYIYQCKYIYSTEMALRNDCGFFLLQATCMMHSVLLTFAIKLFRQC